MSDAAPYSVRDGIAVITLNNPPVNGLGHALRTGITAGMEKAAADATVKAVVLIGSAKAFSGGADIREFNTPKSGMLPSLPGINEAQDNFPKPMVAAIGGFAMGGGLELALGCHYRVAAPKAQLALPEVKLGILPGSGGTQRLPRVVPMAVAVQMMTTGNPIPAEKGKEYGLIDEIVSGDLLEGAIAYAKKLVAEGKRPRRIRDMKAKLEGDPKAFFAAARAEVAKASKGFPAPLEIVACAEAAATLPLQAGSLATYSTTAFRSAVTWSAGRSTTTPSASSRSAEPQAEEAARLPCLATGTPAPATTSAAIVKMLTVLERSPPVPQVSTTRPVTATGAALSSITSTSPATSCGVSPLARRAITNPAI